MNHEDNGVPSVPPHATAGIKQMQTFRLPRELVIFLRAEASRSGRDLTGQVLRVLQGVRTYFGLPAAATSLLDSDRNAMGLDRCDYLLHLLYQRSLDLRERGSGFDAPAGAKPDSA